jgi:hypothetical protein
MRHVLGGKIADGYVGCRGVKQQLMFGEFLGLFGRENYALGALLQGAFELDGIREVDDCAWDLTIGMISAGSLLRRWASSSLYEMRCATSISQEYRLARTFSRIWSLKMHQLKKP